MNRYFNNPVRDRPKTLRLDTKSVILSKLGLPLNTHIGPSIGTKSANGVVFPLGNDHRRVLKMMLSGERDFNNEVRVGKIPGIQSVGTRIYESFYDRPSELGVYVMDNLLGGSGSNRVLSLHDFTRQYYDTCPARAIKERVVKMYVDLLFDFYKITNGWHGDLHTENIQVVMSASRHLLHMRVIDYGSHTPFTSNTRGANCVDAFLNSIANDYRELAGRGALMHWHQTGVPHKQKTSDTQPVISNAAVLKSIHPLFTAAIALGYTRTNIMKERRNKAAAVAAAANRARRNAAAAVAANKARRNAAAAAAVAANKARRNTEAVALAGAARARATAAQRVNIARRRRLNSVNRARRLARARALAAVRTTPMNINTPRKRVQSPTPMNINTPRKRVQSPSPMNINTPPYARLVRYLKEGI